MRGRVRVGDYWYSPGWIVFVLAAFAAGWVRRRG